MRYIIIFILGVLVSFFFFPVSFTFLPIGLNTKIMLGSCGAIAFLINCIKAKEILLSKQLVGSIAVAAVFSGLCLLSCEINDTSDYSYATYIVSFFTWLMGAYMICELLRIFHGRASLPIITKYLAVVCAVQCVLALLIDEIPAVQKVIDSIFYIDKGFFDEIDRLYGIGAALDPAGVRFSVVCILIFYFLINSKNNKLEIYVMLISFFLIVLIGNMISRTTTIGVLLALGYFIFSYVIRYKETLNNYSKIFYPFFIILFIGIGVSIYLYNNNEAFYGNMRFAFEGFFNWYEKGVWETGSTNKLNAVMWIWPTTEKAWIWGTGLFGNYIYNTDIGYCRFILYCGLVGFSVFSMFFIYNSWAIWNLKKIDIILALLLIALTFIIWIKVATDIFFIYALLFCLDSVEQTTTPTELEEEKG